TVEYSAAGNQAIKVASDFGGGSNNQYFNLILSGTGTKSTTGLMPVKNNIDITGGSCVLNPGSFNIQLGGNWTSYGSTGFTEGFVTVTVNGTSDQFITTTGGEVFYNFIISKSTSGSRVILGSNVDIINVLTFTITDRAPLL